MVAVVAGLGTLEAVVAVVEVVLAEVFSVVEVAYWAGSSFSAFYLFKEILVNLKLWFIGCYKESFSPF